MLREDMSLPMVRAATSQAEDSSSAISGSGTSQVESERMVTGSPGPRTRDPLDL